MATGQPGAAIKVAGADAIAIAPGGMVAFVLNFFPGTATPINTATGAVGQAIKVGKGPSYLAIAM